MLITHRSDLITFFDAIANDQIMQRFTRQMAMENPNRLFFSFDENSCWVIIAAVGTIDIIVGNQNDAIFESIDDV